jgi:hypothetical protein
MVSVCDSRLKYSSQPDWPEKVFERKGSRDVAHGGPCSVTQGLVGVKYWLIREVGEGGEMREAQNDVVVLRRSSSLDNEDGRSIVLLFNV